MKRSSVYLNHLGIVCALGDDPDTIRQRMAVGDPDCLSYTSDFIADRLLLLGLVEKPLPSLAYFPSQEQTRCNQLLVAAMSQILEAFEQLRNGIDPLRIGIVLGTSTSGISEGEQAINTLYHQGCFPKNFNYSQQEMSSPAECLARWLNIKGPTYVISTACSSSAKALASARRLLRMNICDLVVSGGVDSLCQLTVNGFDALESVSEQRCQPFSLSRNGINIGEGAALFLLSRNHGPVSLTGVGESSDTYHISAPDPSGAGAEAAMIRALQDAQLFADEIDYLNLHGTATPQNDKMESLAVKRVFNKGIACSSTKPYTGHTLGATGAIEAAICWLTLVQTDNDSRLYTLPTHIWDGQIDTELPSLNLVTQNTQKENLRYTMSNSFAFGGNNISLLLERTQ